MKEWSQCTGGTTAPHHIPDASKMVSAILIGGWSLR